MARKATYESFQRSVNCIFCSYFLDARHLQIVFEINKKVSLLACWFKPYRNINETADLLDESAVSLP